MDFGVSKVYFVNLWFFMISLRIIRLKKNLILLFLECIWYKVNNYRVIYCVDVRNFLE